MNKVILHGTVVEKPKLETISTGASKCSITLAVPRKTYNTEGERESDFISCEAWGKLAETIVNYVRKGGKLIVSGNIRTGSYVDKEQIKRYTTKVMLEEIDFGSRPKKDKEESEGDNE